MSDEKTVPATEAADQQKKSKEPDPQTIEAMQHVAAGNQAFANGKLEEAESEYRKSIEVKEDLRDGLYNLGVLLRDQNRFDEAKSLFHKIIETQPRAAMAHNNLGVILALEQDHEKAIQHYRDGIEDAFQNPTIHFNLGMLLLRLGQYEEGWRECEWRWQTEEFTPIRCLQPRWDGSQLEGTLLVHTEQGAGDTFQFLRFLPQIRERVGKLMMICPEHLMCMLNEGNWADDIRLPGNLQLDQFDAYLPLMSAPFALKQHDEASIPTSIPYLTPDERQIDLGDCHVADARLKVGIAWAGSPTHKNDAYRSMHAKELRRLLEVPNVAFYSLQKGPQTEQLRELSDLTSLRDLDSLQNDYADTAAIMRQLDLVISVDTSVLHLAGGLGIPAWGLLSTRSDWRWLEDRDDTTWYPSLQLFRQTQENDWQEVLGRAATALESFQPA